MKAVRIHEYGDESVLRYEDVPDPSVGPQDVLIRVRAASVNRGDLSRRAGTNATASLTEPLTIGWDVAGDVIEVGSEVHDVSVGQRVVARLGQGGYAEMVTARAAHMVTLPEKLSYEHAASLPVAFLTAWLALLDTAGLSSGEFALVQAAGSGVGMAGVQIAKHVARGRVITTAGTDRKVARALELGADVAVNYNTDDFLARAREFTQGEGIQVALDMVGGAVFTRSQQALGRGGRLVSVGRSSGEAPVADEDLAKSMGQTVVTGWRLGDARTPEAVSAVLAEIVDLVARGVLKTVVDKVFPLRETSDAHRYLASRAQFGKVILRP